MVVRSTIKKNMKKFSIFLLLLCAGSGLLKAQDVYPISTQPIAAEILVDSLAQDSLAQANEPQTIWEDMPFVRIHQPRYIQLLAEGKYIRLTPGKEVRRKTVSANPLGYRLEIYQSNDQRVGQGEANRIRATLTGKVTVPIYVRFYTPFWRVRIGDFRTLEEANAYKRTFLQRFPGMARQTYVVRDHIKAIVVQRQKE